MVSENWAQISMPCQVLCKGQPQTIFLALLFRSVHLGCDWELLLCSVLTFFSVAALTVEKAPREPLAAVTAVPLNSTHWISCAVWFDKWCQQSIRAPERGKQGNPPSLCWELSGILSKMKKWCQDLSESFLSYSAVQKCADSYTFLQKCRATFKKRHLKPEGENTEISGNVPVQQLFQMSGSPAWFWGCLAVVTSQPISAFQTVFQRGL